jgi:hypothetical protein
VDGELDDEMSNFGVLVVADVVAAVVIFFRCVELTFWPVFTEFAAAEGNKLDDDEEEDDDRDENPDDGIAVVETVDTSVGGAEVAVDVREGRGAAANIEIFVAEVDNGFIVGLIIESDELFTPVEKDRNNEDDDDVVDAFETPMLSLNNSSSILNFGVLNIFNDRFMSNSINLVENLFTISKTQNHNRFLQLSFF